METVLPNFTVEKLKEEDITWFVDVAATNMLTEELKRPELLNREHLFALAAKAMNEGTALIAKLGDEPVGAIGALIVPNMFNPNIKTLVEVFWYVLPDYRSTKVGGMLLFALEGLAVETKAEEVTLSLLPTSEVGVENLAKRGFNLEEFGFRKKT